MHKILIKKEMQNAFAQRKFIYMMLGMSILFPVFIPMFDSNEFIEKIIPASFLACFLPNFIALNCASQLIVNSHIEEVKANISRIILYKRINRILYYISKLIIPIITGFACSMLSSIIFHFISGPLKIEEFILIIVANMIWSTVPSIVTTTLTSMGIDDEITLNTIMLFANLAVYGLVVFLSNPLENILLHAIYALTMGCLSLLMTNYLINKKITKIEVSSDGQHF